MSTILAVHLHSRSDILFSEHSQTIVTFIVGVESVKKNFVVHKHLAAAHSPFFKAAFESPMIEGTTQTMRLEDIEVETFGVLVHWMYTKEIKAGLGTFINDKGAPDFDFVTLAKVWKLAERALMPLLQDAIMAELFKKRDTGTIESLVKFTKFFTASEGISRLKGFAILHILWERKDDQLRFLIPRLPRHILNLVVSLMSCTVILNYYEKGCGFDEFFFLIDGAIDLKLKK